MVVDFRPSRRPTLGVEWEVGLVDAYTGDLVSAAAEVVEEARGGIPQGESRVHREQRAVAARAGGDLWAVVDSLVREMRDGLPSGAARDPDHAARRLGGTPAP